MSFAMVAMGTVAAVGVGMSAASAAGAFGSDPEKWQPTPQEQEAVVWNNRIRQLGQKIQAPMDADARRDLQYLRSPGYANQMADRASSQMARQVYPALNNTVAGSLAMGDAVPAGRFWSNLSGATTGLSSAMRGAELGGRLGALQNFMARQEQFLGRRTGDLQSALGSMNTGGVQAAQAQAARIQAQTADKIAANQAMGQLGGTMIGLGTAGYGMATR